MLFITNRFFKEGSITRPGRKVTFDLDENMAGQSVYFCERSAKNKYTELGSQSFLSRLKSSKAEQVFIYIHGFSNLPEPDIFPRAEALQSLFDSKKKNLVEVVPMIWPCDNDTGIAKDYWDDQKAADASAFAFSRVLEKFMHWRNEDAQDESPCLKRINILSHSMGNRVLRETLYAWAKYDRGWELPLLFRNIFMVAADVVNETLHTSNDGKMICDSSRNVLVFYASDDLALRASKVSNLKNKVASRRLGHSGPENMDLVPKNVFAFDCDDYNTRYDKPAGHSYFLYDDSKVRPGKIFLQILDAVKTGRIPVTTGLRRTTVL